MTYNIRERTGFGWVAILLYSAIFGITFSIALGETLLGMAFVILIYRWIKAGKSPVWPLEAWFALAFFAWAVVTILFGVDMQLGFSRLSRLAWFATIPAFATVVRSSEDVKKYLKFFAAGCAVLSVYLLSSNLLEAYRVSAANGTSYYNALVAAGSMTGSQMLVMGILATMGLLFVLKGRKWLLWCVLGLQLVTILLNFKRGSWLTLLILALVFLAYRRKWKVLLLAVLIIGSAAATTPVRSRLAGLRDEMDPWRGGRFTMWTKIAPQLFSENPWTGIGYNSLSNETMNDAAKRKWLHQNPEKHPPSQLVEPRRDHLHSNPVQIIVATGIPGFLLYATWMLAVVARAINIRVKGKRLGKDVRTLHFAALLMILSILINGLVEYNFGDTEMLIVLGSLMGMVGGLNKKH
ncbi:MAG: O-antigen ligase family protein [Verrucomicrobiota bacterium]